uniref:Zinc finger protein n=1 Tax=Rhabditophanes sp. KR3021 TaxID=114890 RepID=A0AC35TQQ1_9BILA
MLGMNVLEEEINICAQMYNGVIFLDTVSFKEGPASTIASDSSSNDSLMSKVNLPIKEEKLQVGQMDENKFSDDSLDNRKPSSIAYGNTIAHSAHFSSPKVNLPIKNEKSQMGHMDDKKVTVVPDSLSNIQKASSNVKPNIIACKPPPVKKDDAQLKHYDKMLHMGHMFENKITINADNSTNGQNPVIIANKHKNAQLMVFEHNGEKMNVFYDSEIDALTEKGN